MTLLEFVNYIIFYFIYLLRIPKTSQRQQHSPTTTAQMRATLMTMSAAEQRITGPEESLLSVREQSE